ncbi:sugar dehydrogenase complex small subunit [Edaphovirga cremea]|uniref:sugar dehydrogenase complex small subunit n=1 Tax=Edaphovirga cremea TaxID=2267246 RepID=UPI0039890F0D
MLVIPPSVPRVSGVSRRRLLGYLGVGLVSSLMSPIPLKAFAAENSSSAADLEKFLLVSRGLTGKRYLNPQIGERLFTLLVKREANFVQQLAALQPLPAGAPASWPQAQQDIARQILQSWYLGKVGEGADAGVVSYEKALMFDAVSDVLVIRSYCPNRPGYWASRPDVAL